MTHSKSKNLSRHSLGAASNEAGRPRNQNPKFSLPRYDPFTAKPGFFLAQVVAESMNRRIPNGCVSPRNFPFSPASSKAANPKVPHSEGRNVELRHLTPFIANIASRKTYRENYVSIT